MNNFTIWSLVLCKGSKLILKHLKPITGVKHLVPTHQFSFRKDHSPIDQVHHTTSIIEEMLENKGVCSAVFLDIAQAFNRVWHRGLLHKLRSILPDHFYLLLKSYLTNWLFVSNMKTCTQNWSWSRLVSHREVYWGQSYIYFYINDVPTTSNSTMARLQMIQQSWQ
jgi:hypothetical protein